MASTAATINIQLNFKLNGEPIIHVLKAPAVLESDDKLNGFTVHLDIDGHEMAKAILPYLVREIRNTTYVRGSFDGDTPVLIREPDEGHS